ncbi:MAG: hypothetical protein AB8G15_12995 [Saprospiraceae bacterium]
MKFTFIAFFFFLQFTLFAQPILISDFNPGTESTFDDGRANTVTINGTTLVVLETESTGREMGYLRNGNLAILKDIVPGTDSSNPFKIFEYKEKFYFTAQGSTNGYDLWVSDGTPEGTEVFDGSFGDAKGLIVSKNDLLYYFVSNELKVTDGVMIDDVLSDVSYNSAIQFTDHNICTYKDEIAFLRQVSSNEIELYIVENGTATLKATKTAGSGFPKIFGMNQVGDDIVFVVDDPFNAGVSGSFRYDDENGTIEPFQIDGKPIARMHELSENLGMAYEPQSGYYAVNGIEGEEVLLAAATNVTLTQNQDFIRSVYQDKIVLAAEQEFFGDYPILFSDGTASGTTVLHTGRRSAPVSILQESSYAFFIYEYAFKDFRLSYINMADGSTGNIYDFLDTETGFQAFPIAVQNDKIYLAINYQGGLGLELYEVNINIGPVSTVPVKEINYTVDFTDRTFTVKAKENAPVKVAVYATNGTLLENISTTTNSSYSLEQYKGLLILQFEVNGALTTKKFFRK